MADDTSPEVTTRPEPLPLDSPDWIPVGEAHAALCRLTGSPGLATKDLTEAFRGGHVPTMRRCFAYGIKQKIQDRKIVGQENVLIGPERELLPREHWDGHRLSLRADGSTEVIEGFGSIVSVKGFAYFAWKPALAKLWPTVAAFAPPASDTPKTGSVAWAITATRKLWDDNKIPEGAKKADLARLLEAESEKAVKAGQIRRALKASYLEDQLAPWGIWPLNSFK